MALGASSGPSGWGHDHVPVREGGHSTCSRPQDTWPPGRVFSPENLMFKPSRFPIYPPYVLPAKHWAPCPCRAALAGDTAQQLETQHRQPGTLGSHLHVAPLAMRMWPVPCPSVFPAMGQAAVPKSELQRRVIYPFLGSLHLPS